MPKQDLIKKYQIHDDDTGSADVQIAVLSKRIEELTTHLKQHTKDFDSRVGLLNLVGQRRRLLNYLKDKDINKYQEIIKDLKLRS